MCGIDGFFAPGQAVPLARYYKAHLTLRHRGPDDEGFVALQDGKYIFCRGDDSIEHYQALPHINSLDRASLVLGHRRLSIIDLTYHGHQPLMDDGGRYALIYNGEIYNYLELRPDLEKAGHRFESHCDTEVLLKAWMEWGSAAQNKFNGMWAFALFDRSERKLILSRDRFGIKPLYYALIEGVLYFASEMKFIRSFVERPFTPNQQAMKTWLETEKISHSEQTFWREIRELEPGHWLEFRDGQIKIQSYWNFTPRVVNYSDEDALARFGELFEDSLKLRMRSDVEVGTLLSGGLDSTLVVCKLADLGYIADGNFKSFSAVFDDERFSEKKYIDSTIRQVPLKPYFCHPRADQMEDYLDRLFHHIEEPFRSLAVYSQFLLYEMIHKQTNVKVLLNGQGSDELFGGYNLHYFILFGALLKQGRWIKMMREIQLYRSHRGVGMRSLVENVIRHGLAAVPHADYFNHMLFREVRQSALREFLRYDDRTSMSGSVEARVPFLDYRIVEFAFSLHPRFKIDRFTNKKIVRDYAAGVIPADTLNRTDKTGFVSPQEVWQRGELKPVLDLAFTAIRREGLGGIVDGGEVWSKYEAYQAAKFENWIYIWRLFSLHRWMQGMGVAS